MCFTCWLRSGFSHFINMDSLSFTWYLAAAESWISKQSGVQDALQNSEPCRCLKTFEDLSESKCSRTRVEKCRLVSPTQSDFQLSVESNPGLRWFFFTVLCEWSRKLAPPSKPIRYKTKTNRDLVTRVFPRLRPVTCVYFDFSLAPSDIFVCSNWPL